MTTLIENIANLFKVKTIITVAFTFAMIYCYIRGQVSGEVFVSLASSVVTYYFTKNVSCETSSGGTSAAELCGEDPETTAESADGDGEAPESAEQSAEALQ